MSEIYSYYHSFFPNISDKDIKKMYNKRRKWLKKGNCPRCAENLEPVISNHSWFPEDKGTVLHKGGITKDNKCPNCETDLMEFCFQDMLDEAKAKAKEIVQQAKATSGSKKVTKKKVSKKKSKKNSSPENLSLW